MLLRKVISILSGNSVRTSSFLRRIINGWIIRAITSGDILLNVSRFGKKPGITTWKIAQISSKRFSNGVPDKAKVCSTFS